MTDYENIVKSVNVAFDAAADKSVFTGCLLRFAGHDMMDFRFDTATAVSSTGGSDGCVDFTDPDNKGLVECLSNALAPAYYEEHCDKVSLADFIVIAGEAVMGRTATLHNEVDYYGQGTFA